MSAAARLAVYAGLLAVVFVTAYLLAGLLVPERFVADWSDPAHEQGSSHSVETDPTTPHTDHGE